MKKEHRRWLIEKIESLVGNKDYANFGIRKGRVDLEIIIRVDPNDKNVFTESLLKGLEDEVASLTGIISPVIYLEGKEPMWLEREILC